jgi:glutamate racemase
MDNCPIGVFDSGIGGLTVARAIMDELPFENIVYFGDLVHLPYGNKSERAIKEFSLANTNFLINKGVKLIVVACNSASSIAINEITSSTSLPVVEVVNPGAQTAVRASKNGRIGVIGTSRTIASGAYKRAISAIKPESLVFQKATPLLVPLIEENWIDREAARLIVREYLDFFKEDMSIDALVLGCTHYPIIKKLIEEEISGVNVIDSAVATALKVKDILKNGSILAERNTSDVSHKYYVNDITESFKELGYRIVGEKIDIENISEKEEIYGNA